MGDYRTENYRLFVARLTGQVFAKPLREDEEKFLYAVSGIVEEAGELMEICYRNFHYGEELDWEHIKEELGDLNHFMQVVKNIRGWTHQEIKQNNIDKLKRRYPEGKFTTKDALERKDKVIVDVKKCPACGGTNWVKLKDKGGKYDWYCNDCEILPPCKIRLNNNADPPTIKTNEGD